MEFNFIDYGDNIFKKSIVDEQSAVYVFNNYENLKEARTYYHRPFLEQGSIFITMSDFKERLFPPDSLVLKEEKLSVIFYELLTDEDREQLQINSYFDAIEVANEFLNFYSELKEYKIEKITDLTDWQQQKYNLFQQLRKKYVKRMKTLGYTDRTLSYDFSNFSTLFLQDYENISFINNINFTPMEKELLTKIEADDKNVIINLQLPAADYDREHLILKTVNFPDNHNTDIHLFQVEEDLLQLVNLIEHPESEEVNKEELFQTNNEVGTIIDADYNNSNYQQLLSSEKIKVERELSFKQTKLYRFLNTLYELIKNADTDRGQLLLQLEDLLDACYLIEFSQYYNLTENTREGLIRLAQEDYVYLNQELAAKEGLTELEPVVADILQIRGFNNLLDFCKFMENIDLEILNDEKYDKNLDRYFDALLELKSLEEMNIVSSWDNYFSSKNQGLFFLILRYLQFKKIEPVIDTEDSSYLIEPLLEGRYCQHNNLHLINISGGIIPTANSGGFLLTENQRENLRLPTARDRRLLEKYYFCRHVFSSDDVNIYSIRKTEDNVTASPFVEELRLKYNLQFKEPGYKAKHYSKVVSGIFNDNKQLFHFEQYPALIGDDKLQINKNDFPKQNYSFNYYKYKTLRKCYYRFYLEHIADLETEKPDFTKEMDLKVLGILVHQIIEKISGQISSTHMGIDNLIVDKKTITRICEQVFIEFNLKFNNYYQKYYREILLAAVTNSIMKFFEKIERKIKNIEDIAAEWQPAHRTQPSFVKHEMIDIYLRGRLDLLINTPQTTHIIDFKTGSGDLDQLDFYAIMLKPYVNRALAKSIYYIFTENLRTARNGSEEKFAGKLEQELQQFLDSNYYKKEFKSYCQRCDYYDICRVVAYD